MPSHPDFAYVHCTNEQDQFSNVVLNSGIFSGVRFLACEADELWLMNQLSEKIIMYVEWAVLILMPGLDYKLKGIVQ